MRVFTNENMGGKVHKGEIRCLLFERIFDLNLVISGSADRTIKIWDLEIKNKDVVQTLT